MALLKIRNIHRIIIFLCVLFVFGNTSLYAANLTAKQILKNASKHYDKVNDYIADVVVSMDSPNMHIPKTKVRVYCKKPDKVHVESKDGIAILPKNGLVMGNPIAEMLKSSSLSITGSAKIYGKDCYIIHSKSKIDDMHIDSDVYIEKKNWLVMRMKSNPAYKSSVDVKINYVLVKNKYWMPSITTVNIAIPSIVHEHKGFKQGTPQLTTAVMKFSNYIINRGIKDSIFKQDSRGGE